MGNKMKRKIQRQGIAKKKKDAQKDMNEKVGLFFQLPEECTNCEKPFDKQSKDMVFSWKVVVMGERVSLFCPECISATQEIIKENNNG